MKKRHLLSISLLLNAPLVAAEDKEKELARLTTIKATRQQERDEKLLQVQTLKKTAEQRATAVHTKQSEIGEYNKEITYKNFTIKHHEATLRQLRAELTATERTKKKSEMALKNLEAEHKATEQEITRAKKAEKTAIKALNSVKRQRRDVKGGRRVLSILWGDSDDTEPESDTEEAKSAVAEEPAPANLEEPIKKPVTNSPKASPVVSDIEEEIATDDEVSASESEDGTIPSIEDFPTLEKSRALTAKRR